MRNYYTLKLKKLFNILFSNISILGRKWNIRSNLSFEHLDQKET